MIRSLIAAAAAGYRAQGMEVPPERMAELEEYIMQRVYTYMEKDLGFRKDLIEACKYTPVALTDNTQYNDFEMKGNEDDS